MFSNVRVRVIVAAAVLLCVSGCGSLMHPKADAYLKQAEGSTGLDTMLNLTALMTTTVIATRGANDYQTGLDDLHNQLYALKKSFCLVTEAQASKPSYVKAVTIKREMRTVFHRLWKYKDDQTLREMHLDLFGQRLEELSTSLHSMKT